MSGIDKITGFPSFKFQYYRVSEYSRISEVLQRIMKRSFPDYGKSVVFN